MSASTAAAVVFVADVARMMEFYRSVFDLRTVECDDTFAVLESDVFQLTIHGLRGEPAASGAAREDTYVKLCFPVDAIDAARTRAMTLGGEIWPPEREWVATSRGFRACDGRDPEGNVFQVRVALD
jgi:predicted enzyme related to lactoylglutathione lyase